MNDFKIFVSVISHAHGDLIDKLECLNQLSSNFTVVVKSNCPGDNFLHYNDCNNFFWLNESYNLGFGQNNNYVFDFCKKELSMKDTDFFVVLNPDVSISVHMLERLILAMAETRSELAAINLYKDFNLTNYDNSIRNFPSFKDFFKSFLFKVNNTILDKRIFKAPTAVDWAAGSFLAFRSRLYSKLDGFDETFFMYCEDIDICKRSKGLGFPVIYYPDILAVHIAQHSNQKFLSKHFFWHIRSIFRYLSKKY
jgi:N-acetylglucosaminyl-diphospho-decaprenol L-rhamnosyltransferase